ncbi:hypothetical protein BDA99DRAFT_559632 [Phascolomyces articulosus]|uniref:Uncharacterized protein n=1 Tax=Phascolomyces articulosus TaxID=60185 RepID=A0AAD5KB46_9FUNG|nr:hypothetical protein BDA99DRAFT_559632 [Phascolomyces articulosus]
MALQYIIVVLAVMKAVVHITAEDTQSTKQQQPYTTMTFDNYQEQEQEDEEEDQQQQQLQSSKSLTMTNTNDDEFGYYSNSDSTLAYLYGAWASQDFPS